MLVPADSQQTTSGLPVDSQQTTSGLRAVSKWTPSGLQGFNVESSFGELFWETIYELPVDSQRTSSGQAPYRLLYLETSFGEFFWRDNWTPSGFSALSGIKAGNRVKNIIFAIY